MGDLSDFYARFLGVGVLDDCDVEGNVAEKATGCERENKK